MRPNSTVAIVANTGLGDALWMMSLVHAFYTAGHAVVLYSDFLCHLNCLFPHISIQPYLRKEERGSMGQKFDRILFQHHSPGSKDRPLPKQARVLYKEEMDLSHSYVWNLRKIGLKEVGNESSEVGLCVPEEWDYRKNQNRVIIHPSSADRTKNWRPCQFITLATRLKAKGYDPRFIIPFSERDPWEKALQHVGLAEPVSLGWLDLAQYLYESGYFIGNDASPGHLASLLQIPTLSLFSRKSRAILYRPSFGPGVVVLPYACLPGRGLRNALWQYFLPVSRVYKAFQQLTKIN